MTSALTFQSQAALARREPPAGLMLMLLRIFAGLATWIACTALAHLISFAMLFERRPKYARRGHAWGSANRFRLTARRSIGGFPNLRNR